MSRLSDFDLQLLGASDAQLAKLENARELGLIELSPVVVPRHARGDNNHMGWPVATMVGETLVVVHRRIPGHNPRGAGKGDGDSTFSMVVLSTDGGGSWTEPFDLRKAMDESYRNLGGELPLSHRYKFGPVNERKEGYKIHLNSVGTTRDGAVVLLCNYGAFRSEDSGRTWIHFPEAFRSDVYDGDIVYLGPRIIDHPDLGLMAFGNTVGYGRDPRFPNPVDGPVDSLRPQLVVLHSKDYGASWEKTEHRLPDWAAQHEPAAALHDGDIFLIGRDQLSHTMHLGMRMDPHGGLLDVGRTNMHDSRFIDTVDLDFNPVTARFEVVRPNRDQMRLDLWSIDPNSWKTGEWRFEGTLFARSSQQFYVRDDGFHPAGAVIDAQRNVQHVFIYTGHPNGPAGSFRLTRTLDTPKLAEFLARR